MRTTPTTPPRRARRRPDAASSPNPTPAAVGDIDVARRLFSASLAPMHGALRLMAQWRETQAGLLHEMDQALGATLREAEVAADVQDLLRLQTELARGNLSRATNAASTLFRTWLETEAALLEQAQRDGADATRQLLQDTQAGRTGSPLGVPGGADLMANARTAWTQATEQWLAALRSGAPR